jgi:hypothetical protein
VRASKRFTSPSGLELALAFEVGEAEHDLPRSPGTVDSRETFPIIYLAREMLGHKDSRQGHHHKFDVGDGHARPFCFFLRILHHDDELGNAIRLHVILHHISAEDNHVDSVQAAAVGVEEGHDLDGHDLCVEGLGVFEIVVPDLIDHVAKEFRNATFGHFVTGVVIEVGFVGHLRTNSDDCRGIIGDVFIVEGKADGTNKRGVAVFGFVLGGIREESREQMDAIQLIIGDDHEERQNTLSDGEEIVVRWFPFERGKGVVRLFEEAGDGIRRHVEMKVNY